jgi:teichuronic acid biosynthesis glycosyltransferase TuaC
MFLMKIKVLALSYLFPNSKNPGYGVFVFNRLKAVAKQCDVKVIAPLQWFPLFNKYRRAAGGKGIGNYEKFGGLDVFYPRFLSIPKFFKWFDSVAYFLSVIPAVCHLKYKEKYDFDVVDVHWTYPDILAGYLISRFYRKKLIITIRGKEALYPGEAGGRKIILNWLLKKADVVVNLSFELKDLVQKIGVKSDRAKVIYNGVDLEQFSYVDKLKARDYLNLPTDKKILLSVGRFTKQKGHQVLVRCLPEVLSDFDVELYLVGGINPEDDYSLQLKKLVADNGLKNVHFIENVNHDELKYWYAAADLFCLASAGEGCPNVVLEAMACGCPVVVSNVGAVSDLVREGESGFVVDLHRWNWSQRIEEALSQLWDRKQIAQQMNEMSWDACADEVVDTYRSVLGGQQERVERSGPMKILYHHRTLGDGAEGIHIREMVAAFRSLGHQVKVIGPVGESVPEESGTGGWLSKIKSVLPNFVFELCEVGYSVYSFMQLSWLIWKEKPDFIYDRYITFNIGCVLSAKLYNVPLFLEVNAPLALERSEQPDEKLHLRKIAFALERWACSNSYKTIVVSTPLKEYLVSQGVSESQIVVMPNGVNTDKFYPHEKDHELAGQLGVEANSTVIGFTGVLRHWHGLEMLIDAFNHVVKTEQNVSLLIVGDGPIRKKLDEQISALNLLGKVIITGKIPYEEVPRYVNLFDVAVSPKATFYASPMKVIEYMALGKAVVVPDSDNFLDIVDVGKSGFVFKSGCCDELSKVLLMLFSSGEVVENAGLNAYKKTQERLNWARNAESVCAILDKS